MSKGKTAVNRSALRSFAESVDSPPDNTPIVILDEMAQLLGQHFDVPLPVSELLRPNEPAWVKNGKKFSVGLLENPGNHEWSTEGYRRLSLRDRTTIAGSLFLWRKTLPSSPATQAEHRARVTAPEPKLPPGYIEHLVRVVEEWFPVGWDSGYIAQVENAVPTTKSVVEKGRGKGGYRSEKPDRLEYGFACMGEGRMTESGRVVKYMDAACDGKSRAVTVMTSEAQRLKPLHRLIYDQISKSPWLLRGEAKPAVFRSFLRKEGEVFVSGDYESASDHLPVTSAEWLLRAMFRRARHIPESIQCDALKYLRVMIKYEDCSVEATRQLMGSLLCFPLLCMQNYAAFRWVFGPLVPVKVNGDDIVFRCAREKYDEWAAFVGSVGLVLSPGKTMVSQSLFSLNSTFFKASKESVRLVPVVRCSTLLPHKCPYPGSLAGSFVRFLKGFRGELRDRLAAWFLRRKGALIRKSGRSVVRGLGVPASADSLKLAGLWPRELWYVNSVPSRFTAIGCETEGEPLPLAPDRLCGQVEVPANWRLRPLPHSKSRASQLLEEEEEFWEELRERAWSEGFDPRKKEREFWQAVSRGGFEDRWYEWRRPPANKLVQKLLGARVRSRLKSKPLYRVLAQPRLRREKRVWTRVDEESWVAQEIAGRCFAPPMSLTNNFDPWVRIEEALDRYIQ
jgi:hypothetical protein